MRFVDFVCECVVDVKCVCLFLDRVMLMVIVVVFLGTMGSMGPRVRVWRGGGQGGGRGTTEHLRAPAQHLVRPLEIAATQVLEFI